MCGRGLNPAAAILLPLPDASAAAPASSACCLGLCWPLVLSATAARHQPLCTCLRCLQEYLSAIKGVGVYRANSGPHDEPRWEAYGAGKPSQ